ncbi:uncharacterized protein MKK02DRAFT_40660 [Dioszegia hungarica]|uniref:Uncharacterized protein n=1 Tax=Dioszegia hungarica TaxID=4972 RepID=A0AA38H0H3_9TREE|nr:uncharacterized protein MKK02DRAFT_40660 [Dioszegia hungarica]KAI9632358.1 hypothetical protein MKK02DRAFT_40660 [Dioszegia hungarica]
MPSCRVVNKTGVPLNICLKQVAALHFENTVKPDQEVKFKPGRVWFTFEAQVDDPSKDTRYSILKSAATIGLLSIAVGAVAATAGAALLPASATAGAVAGASATASYLSRAGWVAKTALVKNAGTIGKISSIAVPKAVEKISSEVGGLTSLQKEVLSIVASPTLSSDVRNKATHLLRSLYGAYSTDKTAPPPASTTALPVNPAPNSASTREAQALDSELNTTHAESHIENVPVSSGTILRVHGIYMDRRRYFEVRLNSSGHLELWDAERGERWDRKMEATRDKAEKDSLKREEKQDKEMKKAEKAELAEKAEKEPSKKAGWGWPLGGRGKKGAVDSDGEETDAEDDGDSTSVMLDEKKEGEVTILERRPTLKERLDGLVHPTQDAAGETTDAGVRHDERLPPRMAE